MATIAEFVVPSDAFPLGTIFEELPDVTVELERVVPTGKSIFPYFWVQHDDPTEVLAVLADHPELESVRMIDDIDGHALFRAEWNENVKGIVTAIEATEIALLSAVGKGGEWVFELRAEEVDELSKFQQYCKEQDVDVTLTRLQSLAEMRAGEGYNLTPEQREALTLAFEEGYYEDSRETDLEDLASKLGITRPSVSDRLRRGYRNLIGSTLISESDSE